jgi:hypothetical protein
MSERITIKALDRTAAFCQVGDCGKPALYLISETKPGFSLTAYCEVHADQVASRFQLILPPAKDDSRRWSRATA